MPSVIVDKARLKEEFLNLVRISSESLAEKDLADYLAGVFHDLADEIIYDNSQVKTGSNTSNMIIKVRGKRKAPPLLLCAHLDTVIPGKNVKPIVDGDVIRSDGTTILGSDCKSGIAIIIETIKSLKEQNVEHGDIEILFTVCEEIGLLGAKRLDYSLIESKFCFALDSGGVMRIINKAPSSNKIRFKIFGVGAHAGLEPENGISAIQVASRAVDLMKLGRIDFETTANIGTVHGGSATNIIPNLVVLDGEARSHDPEKLKMQTELMRKAVMKAVSDYKRDGGSDLPRFEEEILLEYERFAISEDDGMLMLCKDAAQMMGDELKIVAAGGGSDANIFNKHGINSVILSTGMTDVHTVKESANINDMYKNACLLINIIRLLPNPTIT